MRDDDETPRRVLLDPNDETRGYLLWPEGGVQIVTVEQPDDVLDSLLAGIQSERDN